MAIFISKHITDKKNHYFILRHFKTLLINIILYFKIFRLQGVYFRLHGKFKGVLKKKKYIVRWGKTTFQPLKVLINFGFFLSFTKYGVFSIKV